MPFTGTYPGWQPDIPLPSACQCTTGQRPRVGAVQCAMATVINGFYNLSVHIIKKVMEQSVRNAAMLSATRLGWAVASTLDTASAPSDQRPVPTHSRSTLQVVGYYPRDKLRVLPGPRKPGQQAA